MPLQIQTGLSITGVVFRYFERNIGKLGGLLLESNAFGVTTDYLYLLVMGMHMQPDSFACIQAKAGNKRTR